MDKVDKHSYDSAKMLKDQASSQSQSKMESGTKSHGSKPPSTRQFTKAYAQFYDVQEDNLNDKALQKVKDLKDGKSVNAASSQGQSNQGRINTNYRQDPNFQANIKRFLGNEPQEKEEMYKNYRAFYGGATPAMNKASYMGSNAQNQQKNLFRNKLAENAQRILETDSFENVKAKEWLENRRQMAKMSQEEVLKQSGFQQ